MGNTAVAVLHYDMHGEIKDALPRAAMAMLTMPGQKRPQDFGCGAVVSWDHASGYQVVVVHGNTGWRIGNDENVPPTDVLASVAEALRRHGYKVTAPKK